MTQTASIDGSFLKTLVGIFLERPLTKPGISQNANDSSSNPINDARVESSFTGLRPDFSLPACLPPVRIGVPRDVLGRNELRVPVIVAGGQWSRAL